jgi:acyl-CoA synthetase (AMP-forming)/AMP-acid ligase II
MKPPSLYEDGWYRTMDLGRVDATGRLQLAGRFDDSVKRDGFLVAFGDVERALQRLDAIERAVIVPGGMTARGRELVAICTASGDVTPDAATLRRMALDHLPGHAVPDRILFVDALPLTATAKPDRLALAAMVR